MTYFDMSREVVNGITMLTSVLETCRLKGKSILVFLKDVLNTPDEKIHVITKSLLDSL